MPNHPLSRQLGSQNVRRLSVLLAAWLLVPGGQAAAEPSGWDVGPRTWLIDVPRHNIVWGPLKPTQPDDGGTSSRAIPYSMTLHGIDSPHGIAMYPDGAADYPLDGKYRTLRGAAFIYAAQCEPPSVVRFKIVGDDKPLWESLPMRTKDSSQPFLVDVTGVKVLRMQVVYEPRKPLGKNDFANAGWHEPFLSTAPASPEDLAMFSDDRWRLLQLVEVLAHEAGVAFANSDFATVEKIAARFESEAQFQGILPHPRTNLINVLVAAQQAPEHVFRAYLARLSAYAEKFPTSAIPRLALARTYENYAFKARGGGWASEVTEENQKLFQERMAKSADAAAEPASEQHDYALRFQSLLVAAACRGDSQEEADALLDRAIEVDPNSLALYLAVGHWWDPRWGAPPGTIAAVAKKLRQSLPEEQAGLACYCLAASQWEYYRENIYEVSQLRPEDVRIGARLILRHQAANRLHVNIVAALACYGGDRELAREAFKIVDNAHWSMPVWWNYQNMIKWRNQTLGEEAGLAHDQPSMISQPGTVWCHRMFFAADSKSLLTLSVNAINQWNVEDQKFVRGFRLRHPTAAFCPVPGKPDEFMVVTMDPIDDAYVHRVAFGNDIPMESYLGPVAPPNQEIFVANEKQFYILDRRTIWQWSFDDPKVSRSHEVSGIITNSPFGGDTFLISDGNPPKWQLWDFDKQQYVGQPFSNQTPQGNLFTPHEWRQIENDQKLLVVSNDRVVTVNLADAAVSERFAFDRYQRACTSPDLRLLALGFANGEIEVRDLNSGKVLGTLLGHRTMVSHITFSPDSKWLASLGGDEGVKIWPLAEIRSKLEP